MIAACLFGGYKPSRLSGGGVASPVRMLEDLAVGVVWEPQPNCNKSTMRGNMTMTVDSPSTRHGSSSKWVVPAPVGRTQRMSRSCTRTSCTAAPCVMEVNWAEDQFTECVVDHGVGQRQRPMKMAG